MKSPFRCGPVPLIIELGSSVGINCFPQRLIQLECFIDNTFGLWPNVRRQNPVARPERVVKTETRVRRCVRWVEFDCLSKIIPDLFVTRREKISPEVTSL